MAQLTLLDPINVLSEAIPDAYSPDGGLVIVDEKELLSDNLLSSLAVSIAFSGELKIKEEAFLFNLPIKAKKLFPFLNLTWQEAQFYKLIAIATDMLAREVTKIPEVSPTGERYTEDQRLLLFYDAIADRVRRFLLDELPETLVATLGHSPQGVFMTLWFNLQTWYQMMYLLSGHKAGFDVPSFTYHYLPSCMGEEEKYLLPISVSRNWQGVYFYFDCERALGFDADDDYYDFFFIRDLFDYGHTTPESKDYNRFGRWQSLHIEGVKGGPRTDDVCKRVLDEGIVNLADKDVTGRFFATEVVKRGVRSNQWVGIYKPAINFDY